jgi:hypothetical protein
MSGLNYTSASGMHRHIARLRSNTAQGMYWQGMLGDAVRYGTVLSDVLGLPHCAALIFVGCQLIFSSIPLDSV